MIRRMASNLPTPDLGPGRLYRLATWTLRSVGQSLDLRPVGRGEVSCSLDLHSTLFAKGVRLCCACAEASADHSDRGAMLFMRLIQRFTMRQDHKSK